MTEEVDEIVANDINYFDNVDSRIQHPSFVIMMIHRI